MNLILYMNNTLSKINREELLWGYDYISNEIFKKNGWETLISKSLFKTEKRAPNSPKMLIIIDSNDNLSILFNDILKVLNEY